MVADTQPADDRATAAPPTLLDYVPARPSAARRAWRRVRLPLLVIALLAAVLLTPTVWRRVDDYLIEREVQRWTRWSVAAKAQSRLVQNVDATPARVAGLRVIVSEFEPLLPGALHHRSPRVRARAAETIGAALSELSPSVRKPPLKPPLFSDATRKLCYERYVSDLSDHRASFYLWDAMASGADRPVDLRVAMNAWPNLPQARRTMLIRFVRVLGPQTPHAGEFLLLADPPPRGRTWCQLEGLLTAWFPPGGRYYVQDGDVNEPQSHWQIPSDREVLDPETAVRFFGGCTYPSGRLTSSAVAVLALFGPRAGSAAVERLPDLDATAATAEYDFDRVAPADAARAIRAANNLPQPTTQPAARPGR